MDEIVEGTEEEKAEKKDESENILKTILEKESWEDVIYYIVSVENIDPWNVDLVKLTDNFLKFVRKAQDLGFRIPAKIVFVSAILLKLKAENLSIFEEETAVDEMLREGKPFEQLGIDPNLVQLGYPMKRIPKRQVTLEELMASLKAATKVKERRDVRRRLWKEHVRIDVDTGEGIEKRIEKMMGSIDEIFSRKEDEKIQFKDLVKEWKRDKIVESFVPVLHLEQERKIETEQEDFFKDIFVKERQQQD